MARVVWRILGAIYIIFGGFSAPAQAQTAPTIQIERVTIHAPSVAGNLEGNSAERGLIVVLPPSYAANPNRHYPVAYMLHGYSIDNEIWSREIALETSVSGAFADGVQDMIVVLPNSRTLHNGSLYSSSVTVGDFENFIAQDVVAYMDSHYRTIARREARGLGGHSMGGYGVLRIGMRHPDVFGTLYAMSPCCLSVREPLPAEMAARLEAITTPEQAVAASWFERATMAMAAAWSPNPNAGPLFLDRPSENGVANTLVLARWAANSPLALLDQNVFNLRRYNGIGIDVGDKDGLKTDAEAFAQRLTDYGINHQFLIYDGDHVNRLPDRVRNHALPFFSTHLSFNNQ